MRDRRTDFLSLLSPGAWAIAALAVISAVLLIISPVRDEPGLEFWLFSREHRELYFDLSIAEWNSTGNEPIESTAQASADAPRVNVRLFSIPALERRMMGGFLAGVDTADLMEVERQAFGPVVAGPLESVGFEDLTDRLEAEGIRERIVEPSFSPWMSRGRIFGLPHDVHPVMLGYRADLVEAAGIDVSEIETWDDFRRVMSPLMTELDSDGKPARYLLGFWPTQWEKVEILLLQGGGRLFDERGIPTLDDERNAEILAEIVSWCMGDDRWAADVGDFTTTSNNQKIKGYAVAYFMPDWMCRIWKDQIPQLSGKVKLMPLPAFGDDPERRRTSVWGGTMLGVPKTAEDPDASWELAKELYLSDEIARRLYAENDIVTPMMDHWDDPVFARADPYFMGQQKGLDYIALAPSVPVRPSSPFSRQAAEEARNAAYNIWERAGRLGALTPEELLPIAREELAQAQAQLAAQIDRNVFLTQDADGSGADGAEGGD